MPNKDNDLFYREFENNDLFYREVEVWDRSGFDEEKRRDQISFSSENNEVRRWFGLEILDHSGADFKRLNKTGAFLFNHNPNRIIGPIYQAKIKDSRGVAEIGYDETSEGELALKRRKSGSLKGTSFGYRVNKFKELQEGEMHTLSSGKTIKGRADLPIFVAVKWEAFEITATAIPWDSSVGIGRDLTRSLDGIEIERTHIEEEEMPELTKEQIEKLIADGLKSGMAGIVPEIVTQVRAGIAEEARPQIRMSTEVFTDLVNRAGAISLEAKSTITDMTLAGKTEQEVTHALLDLATGKPDANDNGGTGGDPVQRQAGTASEPQITGSVRSFKQISDEDFFGGIKSPSQLPM